MMKKILQWCFLCWALCPAMAQAQRNYSEKAQAYVQQYKDWAISEQQRTNVPAAIKLAQGIYETGAGESDLCIKANNHFGIKCKSTWTGNTFHKDDDAKDECFRSYANSYDSYKDHSDFLKNNKRYASLFTLPINDYKGWSNGLKKCGYATNPVYAQRLIKIIEDYNLNEYTELAKKVTIMESPTVNSQEQFILTQYKPADNDNPVVIINNLKAVYCKRGTPLLDVAMQHNIRYAKLLEMNDLPDAPIPFDMYIYLQRKPIKGIRSTHTVKPGETLLHVAQGEGVQLVSILQFNNLQADDQPTVGSELYLQEPSQLKPTLVAKTESKTSVRQNRNEDEYIVIRQESNVANQEVNNTSTASPTPVPKEVVDPSQTSISDSQPKETETTRTEDPVSSTENVIVVEKIETINNETVKKEEPENAADEPQDEFSRLQRKLDRIVYKEKRETASTTPATNTNTTIAPKAATTPTQYHTVKKGETAYGITKQYGITMKQLMEWNSLSFQELKVGQKLKVQP